MTTKPFKTRRAAQLAMTKAEKTYSAACNAAACAYAEAMNTDGVDPLTAHRDALTAREAAYDAGAAIYAQAKSQGFYVRTWHFSDCNPTRDLIAANRD